jgi:chromosome segregation ATPase
MDAGSDSSRCELDSTTSIDSLQIITDEFRFNHLATPDVTNTELSNRIASLELENEHLRVDLENSRIEINAKNAANQGLKNKIAELYMEARSSLQEKQKLHNSVIDVQCRLAAAENSTQWYQGQMHDVQAKKKTLEIELHTYQIMLRQKHQTLLSVTSKWKELNEDYLIVIQKHKKERDILQAEIQSLKMNDNSIKVSEV